MYTGKSLTGEEELLKEKLVQEAGRVKQRMQGVATANMRECRCTLVAVPVEETSPHLLNEVICINIGLFTPTMEVGDR